MRDKAGVFTLAENPYWTVISRASTKPGAEPQFGEWEIWNNDRDLPSGRVQVQGKLQTREDAENSSHGEAINFVWSIIIAFRRVIELVRGEMVLCGMSRGLGLEFFRSESLLNAATHRITLPTIDGKLATGEYTGPDGSVIKIEDLS